MVIYQGKVDKIIIGIKLNKKMWLIVALILYSQHYLEGLHCCRLIEPLKIRCIIQPKCVNSYLDLIAWV